MRVTLAIVVCFGALMMFGCPDEAPPPPTQVIRVDIDATEFRFEPDEIMVSPGQPLRVVLRNVGTDVHSIAIVLPGREIVLEPFLLPGQTGELRFDAPIQPGAFEFYCPVGNHRELGMVGTLVVERRE